MADGPKFARYHPKKWKPDFDLIVIKSAAGLSNKELAEEFNYSTVQISNIISSPQANEIRDKIRETINTEMGSKIADTITHIGNRAVERLNDFVNNDNLAAHAPIPFTREIIKIATATGMIGETEKKGNNIINNNGTINAIIASGESMDQLTEALKLSQLVTDTHKGLDPAKELKLIKEA